MKEDILMRNIKKYIVILLVTLILLSCVLITNASGIDNINNSDKLKEAEEFALQKGLDMFKKEVSSNPKGYGFDSIDEVNNIVLGQGYQLNL